MEDMRAILVDQNAVLVVMIVSVAANVRALIANQHTAVRTACQTLSKHASSKTRAHHEVIEHGGLSFRAKRRWRSPFLHRRVALLAPRTTSFFCEKCLR